MMGLLPTGSLVTLMILAARSLFAVMVVVLLSDAISPQHTVPLEASANAKQPHLIFILVDDLGWNDIGLHDERVQTPTIDALAQDGVVLDRHYVYRCVTLLCCVICIAFFLRSLQHSLTFLAPLQMGLK